MFVILYFVWYTNMFLKICMYCICIVYVLYMYCIHTGKYVFVSIFLHVFFFLCLQTRGYQTNLEFLEDKEQYIRQNKSYIGVCAYHHLLICLTSHTKQTTDYHLFAPGLPSVEQWTALILSTTSVIRCTYFPRYTCKTNWIERC